MDVQGNVLLIIALANEMGLSCSDAFQCGDSCENPHNHQCEGSEEDDDDDEPS